MDSKYTGAEVEDILDNAYKKPINGIPKKDLESEVQTSLGKADNAYPKTGGTLESTSYELMTLKRTVTGGGVVIRFMNNDGVMGSIGLGNAHNPVFNNGTSTYEILTKDTGYSKTEVNEMIGNVESLINAL